MIAAIIGVLGGIGSGMMAGILGYAKTAKGTEFDEKAFLQTVVIGGFVGAVAGEMGVSYAQAQDYVVTTGFLTLFEYVKKLFIRRVVPWLREKLSPSEVEAVTFPLPVIPPVEALEDC